MPDTLLDAPAEVGEIKSLKEAFDEAGTIVFVSRKFNKPIYRHLFLCDNEGVIIKSPRGEITPISLAFLLTELGLKPMDLEPIFSAVYLSEGMENDDHAKKLYEDAIRGLTKVQESKKPFYEEEFPAFPNNQRCYVELSKIFGKTIIVSMANGFSPGSIPEYIVYPSGKVTRIDYYDYINRIIHEYSTEYFIEKHIADLAEGSVDASNVETKLSWCSPVILDLKRNLDRYCKPRNIRPLGGKGRPNPNGAVFPLGDLLTSLGFVPIDLEPIYREGYRHQGQGWANDPDRFKNECDEAVLELMNNNRDVEYLSQNRFPELPENPASYIEIAKLINRPIIVIIGDSVDGFFSHIAFPSGKAHRFNIHEQIKYLLSLKS